ncbi:MAG: 30S ribosomal protein S16 [Candidatus Moraniibacteriota bacterium]
MLTIRLVRGGKKNNAQFKVMLQERTIAPGGRHVEILGSYNPHLKKATLQTDRIKYWIEKGAHVSDTAYNLLVKNSVITGEKRKVKLPEKKVEVAPVTETPAEAATKAPAEVKAEEVKEEVVPEKVEEVAKAE